MPRTPINMLLDSAQKFPGQILASIGHPKTEVQTSGEAPEFFIQILSHACKKLSADPTSDIQTTFSRAFDGLQQSKHLPYLNRLG